MAISGKGLNFSELYFLFLGEVDSSFHFLKNALVKKQGLLNISLANAIETGISSVDYAVQLWEKVCVDRFPTETGSDGFWFRGRKILKIHPGSLSKYSCCIY